MKLLSEEFIERITAIYKLKKEKELEAKQFLTNIRAEIEALDNEALELLSQVETTTE